MCRITWPTNTSSPVSLCVFAEIRRAIDPFVCVSDLYPVLIGSVMIDIRECDPFPPHIYGKPSVPQSLLRQLVVGDNVGRGRTVFRELSAVNSVKYWTWVEKWGTCTSVEVQRWYWMTDVSSALTLHLKLLSTVSHHSLQFIKVGFTKTRGFSTSSFALWGNRQLGFKSERFPWGTFGF